MPSESRGSERLRLLIEQVSPPSHPAQIALRTWALALSLSLGPALLPYVKALVSGQAPRPRRSLGYVLQRELGINGFAFAITVAVGGGTALQAFWGREKNPSEWPWDTPLNPTPPEPVTPARAKPRRESLYSRLKEWLGSFSSYQKSMASFMLSSTIAILLLQARHSHRSAAGVVALPYTVPFPASNRKTRVSPTLDLTLLLLVRAIDSAVQAVVFKRTWTPSMSEAPSRDPHGRPLSMAQLDALLSSTEQDALAKRRQLVTAIIDGGVFWVCCARIMWCYLYEPDRLPPIFTKWIDNLALADNRLLGALRFLRSGEWAYGTGSAYHSHLLTTNARDLGLPEVWGDPALLPAYGGNRANAIWRIVGVTSRPGVGGLPCEIVHGDLVNKLGWAHSCTAATFIKFARAFLQVLPIYLPAHFLPILLTNPHLFLRPRRLVKTLTASLRSATFLSAFVASFWYTICFTRTVFWARWLPFISHNFWDGPLGGTLAASLICGASILIENSYRWGEMSLYVLPRAINACLPRKWIRSGSKTLKLAECVTFVISLAYVLTASVHQPDSLRGLSRWTLAFVMRGPNAGFWKRKRQHDNIPPTPVYPFVEQSSIP